MSSTATATAIYLASVIIGVLLCVHLYKVRERVTALDVAVVLTAVTLPVINTIFALIWLAGFLDAIVIKGDKP